MTKYIILVACRDLKFEDGSSARISLINSESGEEEAIGQTGKKKGETPVFDEYFEFECRQPDDDLLKVTILDENDESRGVATYTLSKIQQHDHNLGALTLSADRGTVVVHATEKNEGGSVRLSLRAKDLKNIEGYTRLRKSDPFYTLSRPGDGAWTKIYTSVVEMNNLDPDWPVCDVPVGMMCNANFDLPLKLEVFDQENDGKHESMGWVETSVNKLLAASGTNQTMRLMAGNEEMGTVFVTNAELDGCVDSIKEAKTLMDAVGVALEARSTFNDKAALTESLREEAAAAKEAAEVARLAAEQKANELEDAEAGITAAAEVAEAAEASVGGIVCE